MSRFWLILLEAFPQILLQGIKVTLPLTAVSFFFALIISVIVAAGDLPGCDSGTVHPPLFEQATHRGVYSVSNLFRCRSSRGDLSAS